MSHPLRVRGLKRDSKEIILCSINVASFTGAWIETTIQMIFQRFNTSRILYGCVD